MLFCVAALTCEALTATGLVANIYPNTTTKVGDKVLLECDSEIGSRYNKTLYCAYDSKNDTFRLQGDTPHCPGILLCTFCCKLCTMSLEPSEVAFVVILYMYTLLWNPLTCLLLWYLLPFKVVFLVKPHKVSLLWYLLKCLCCSTL